MVRAPRQMRQGRLVKGWRTMMNSGSSLSLERANPSVSLAVGMLMLNRGPAMATSGTKPSPRHVRDGDGVHNSCSSAIASLSSQ